MNGAPIDGFLLRQISRFVSRPGRISCATTRRQHAPILGRFPSIRSLILHSPSEWADPFPVRRADTLSARPDGVRQRRRSRRRVALAGAGAGARRLPALPAVRRGSDARGHGRQGDLLMAGEDRRRVLQRDSNPHLFRPLTLRSVTVRNRIMVSPMCQYSATDGLADDWHFAHLAARAVGGAGIVCAEATHVEARGRITKHCLGLWNDDQRDRARAHRKLHRAAGRGAGDPARRMPAARLRCRGLGRAPSRWPPDDGAWEVIGPSPRPFKPGHAVPREMDQNLIERSGRGVRRRGAAGARGRLSHHRAACRSRLSGAPIPVAAEQPAHRPLRRNAREPRPPADGDDHGGARRMAGRASACSCACR